MDWKQLISLKPVICQLLKSNNCWFWEDQLSGLRLEFELFWGRNQFEHVPCSIQIQTVFRRKTAWKRFESGLKTVWNQLCMSTHVKIYDLKTLTDLKTAIFWKQLWIRITGHSGNQLSGFSLKTVTDWKQLRGSKTVICQLLNPDNWWFRGPVIRIGSNPDNYL